MRIKSLQIAGFKSFVNKTAFSFDYGISGIVGPNGCGKSNVVDAIRWAMGEQSPRRLRGKGMEDVIFAGSDARAPVGLAEVVLIFDNSDGRGPPDFAARAEIEVARRLYRNGESEYLLNQTPCRLRDVLDFFRDTGIGTKGYTIVEQGRIAEIVSARPEERRTLIEEAAGISKYRARRREAERKLESTEQNLLRVRDVLAEIRRQILSIERQARRAAQYKRFREQQRALELLHASEERSTLLAELETARAKLEEQRDAVLETETRMREHEAGLETRRVALGECEQVLSQGNEALFQVRAAIKELESRIAYETRERESLLEFREVRSREREQLLGQMQSAEEEAARANDEFESVRRVLAEGAEAKQAAEDAAREAARALHALEGERDAENRALVEALTGIARLENRLAQSGDRRAELDLRLRSTDEQLELKLSESAEAESEQQKLEQSLRALLNERDRLMGLLRDTLARHEQNTARVKRFGAELRKRSETRELRRARLDSLREVLARAEDLGAGARHLAGLPEAERARLGLRGLLREAFEVDADALRAVEAVLAERAEGMLLQRSADPLQILETLRHAEAGRGVLVLELDTDAAPTAAAGDAAAALPGVALLTKLRFKDASFEAAGLALLAGVRLVENLSDALALRPATRGTAVFVTRAGDVLTPDGVIRGGGDATQTGLLARGRELSELEEQVAALNLEVRELETRQSESETALQTTSDELDNLRNRHHTAALAVASHEKDLERTRERVKTLDEVQQGRAEERSAFLSAADEADAERAELEAELESAQGEKQNHQRQLDALALKLGAAGREHTRLEAELGSQRERYRAREELRDRIQATRERSTRGVSETRLWIQQRETEIADGAQRCEALAQSVARAETELAGRLRDEELSRQSSEQKREAYEQQASAVREVEEGGRELQRALGLQRDAVSEAELGTREMDLRLGHLDEQVRDKWNVSLADWRPPSLPSESETPDERVIAAAAGDESETSAAAESAADATAGAARDALRDARELASLLALDAKERSKALTRIRGRIESIGEVNLGAIEEHEALRERFSFLEEQKTDLESSVSQLREAIARINRSSRRRFRETFDQVKEKFEQNFPRLFRGGKASLSLTESEDVLEAGIEIMAQPPGKHLQSVNLLSGGEKTMTAIALLVSVFQVRPSPFFLLDEVDAALDDANIDRFNEIVREMASDSQFLMITHNKRTIEIADVLYGVTMEEEGVSKLVSVDLH